MAENKKNLHGEDNKLKPGAPQTGGNLGILPVFEVKRTHNKMLSKIEKYRLPPANSNPPAQPQIPRIHGAAPAAHPPKPAVPSKRAALLQAFDAFKAMLAKFFADRKKPPKEKAASKIKQPAAPKAANPKAAKTTQKPEAKNRVKYPILFKLIAIITVLLLISLGTITVLVSALVSSDVQLTAELNNFSINRRNAGSINNELRNIRSSVSAFLNDISVLEFKGTQGQENLVDFFFQQNRTISAIIISEAGEGVRYIMPRSIQSPTPVDGIATWLESETEDLERARSGETVLCNASPVFGFAQLVMLLPVSIWVNGQSQGSFCAAVFFSQEYLTRMLGSGANISFLLNDKAEVLLHPDASMVLGAANLANIPFIESAISSVGRTVQTIYVDENGVEYFGVFQRLTTGNALLVTIIKRDDVFTGITSTTRRNIIISVIVLAFSIFAIAVFAGTLSRPLRTLALAARKIEHGDYELGLSYKSHDEIGVLTQSFVGMGLGLENFEKFTNKAVVALARRGKLSRGGVNKKVTVSFIIIRDFSELSHKMSAVQIVGFVNEYLAIMVPCITATGGIVDKFLTQGGVIIMAIWGSIDSAGTPEKDAYDCIRSMLMMRASLVEFNQELSKRFWGYAPLIKIGCGINSGEVVAGQMGSERRMEYTVIGDTVNLAARLEGANDLFDTDILISQETWQLVQNSVLVQEMQNLEVKGKTKPLRVFSVVNMKSAKSAESIFELLAKIKHNTDDAAKMALKYWATTMEEVRLLWSKGLDG